MYMHELESVMKLLVTKQVLPSDKPLAQIRSVTDMAQFLLFPFTKLYLPQEIERDSSSQNSQAKRVDVTSQISHNLSNRS